MYVRTGMAGYGLGSVGVPAMIQLPVPPVGGVNIDVANVPGISDFSTKKLSQNGLKNFQTLMATGLNMPNAIEEAFQIQNWCDEYILGPNNPNPLTGGQGANWQCGGPYVPFASSTGAPASTPAYNAAISQAPAGNWEIQPFSPSTASDQAAAASAAAQDAAARQAAAAAYVPPPVAMPQAQSYSGPVGTVSGPIPVASAAGGMTPSQIQAAQATAQQSAAAANVATTPGNSLATSSTASSSSSSSSMLDGAMSWISANPMLAAGIALGALFVFGGGMGGRR